MILKNDPAGPLDYVLPFYWAASVTSGGLTRIESGRIEWTWGNAYSSGVHGFQMVVITTDPATGSDSFSITIESPWTPPIVSHIIDSGSAWHSTDRLQVRIASLQLTGGCDDWRLRHDGLEIVRVDEDEEVIETLFTIDAVDESGTLYDPRKNVLVGEKGSPLSSSLVVPQPGLTCAASAEDELEALSESSGTLDFGWKYGSPLVGALIDIKTPATPTLVACSGCVPERPGFTYTGGDSYVVSISSKYRFDRQINDLGEVEGHCEENGTGGGGETDGAMPRVGIPEIVRAWEITQEMDWTKTLARLARKDAKMRKHSEQVSWYCKGDPLSLGTFGVESHLFDDTHAVCETVETTYKGKWFKTCFTLVSPGLCPEGYGMVFPFDPETECQQYIVYTVSWPEKPPCPDASGNVSIDVDSSNGLAVRTVIRDGQLSYEWTDANRVWTTVETGISAKWAKVRIDKGANDRPINIILQTDSDQVKLFQASPFGEDLTEMKNYGDGKYPAIMCGPDGIRQIVWIDGSNVSSVIEQRDGTELEPKFTAFSAVDEYGIDICEDTVDNANKRVNLVVVQGGEVIGLESDDFGKTFS